MTLQYFSERQSIYGGMMLYEDSEAGMFLGIFALASII